MRPVVFTCPVCQYQFEPQQETSPVVSSAQLCRPPTETSTAPASRPITSTGPGALAAEPLPSWPSAFSPQQLTPPPVAIAQVCHMPAATAVTVRHSPFDQSRPASQRTAHRPPEHTLRVPGGTFVGQIVQLDPQASTESSGSQLDPQAWKPVRHSQPQRPPRHAERAFAGTAAEQGMQSVPHAAAESSGSHDEAHAWKPVAHAHRQVSATHVGVPLGGAWQLTHSGPQDCVDGAMQDAPQRRCGEAHSKPQAPPSQCSRLLRGPLQASHEAPQLKTEKSETQAWPHR